jgi:hypothetical protein
MGQLLVVGRQPRTGRKWTGNPDQKWTGTRTGTVTGLTPSLYIIGACGGICLEHLEQVGNINDLWSRFAWNIYQVCSRPKMVQAIENVHLFQVFQANTPQRGLKGYKGLPRTP